MKVLWNSGLIICIAISVNANISYDSIYLEPYSMFDDVNGTMAILEHEELSINGNALDAFEVFLNSLALKNSKLLLESELQLLLYTLKNEPEIFPNTLRAISTIIGHHEKPQLSPETVDKNILKKCLADLTLQFFTTSQDYNDKYQFLLFVNRFYIHKELQTTYSQYITRFLTWKESCPFFDTLIPSYPLFNNSDSHVARIHNNFFLPPYLIHSLFSLITNEESKGLLESISKAPTKSQAKSPQLSLFLKNTKAIQYLHQKSPVWLDPKYKGDANRPLTSDSDLITLGYEISFHAREWLASLLIQHNDSKKSSLHRIRVDLEALHLYPNQVLPSVHLAAELMSLALEHGHFRFLEALLPLMKHLLALSDKELRSKASSHKLFLETREVWKDLQRKAVPPPPATNTNTPYKNVKGYRNGFIMNINEKKNIETEKRERKLVKENTIAAIIELQGTSTGRDLLMKRNKRMIDFKLIEDFIDKRFYMESTFQHRRISSSLYFDDFFGYGAFCTGWVDLLEHETCLQHLLQIIFHPINRFGHLVSEKYISGIRRDEAEADEEGLIIDVINAQGEEEEYPFDYSLSTSHNAVALEADYKKIIANGPKYNIALEKIRKKAKEVLDADLQDTHDTDYVKQLLKTKAEEEALMKSAETKKEPNLKTARNLTKEEGTLSTAKTEEYLKKRWAEVIKSTKGFLSLINNPEAGYPVPMEHISMSEETLRSLKLIIDFILSDSTDEEFKRYSKPQNLTHFKNIGTASTKEELASVIRIANSARTLGRYIDETNFLTWAIEAVFHFTFHIMSYPLHAEEPKRKLLYRELENTLLSAMETTLFYYEESATHMEVDNTALRRLLDRRQKIEEKDLFKVRKTSLKMFSISTWNERMLYFRRGSAIRDQLPSIVESSKDKEDDRLSKEDESVIQTSNDSIPSLIKIINGLIHIGTMFDNQVLEVIEGDKDTPPFISSKKDYKNDYREEEEWKFKEFKRTLRLFTEHNIYDPLASTLNILFDSAFTSPPMINHHDSLLAMRAPTLIKLGGKERYVSGSIIVRMNWIMAQEEFYVYSLINATHKSKLKGLTREHQITASRNLSMLIFHAIARPFLDMTLII